MFTNIEFLCNFHKYISAQQVRSITCRSNRISQRWGGGDIGVCAGECGSAGGSAPHTPKYLVKFSFVCNLHNRARFCETIKTRVATLCFNCNYTYSLISWSKQFCLLPSQQGSYLWDNWCMVLVKTYGCYLLFDCLTKMSPASKNH